MEHRVCVADTQKHTMAQLPLEAHLTGEPVDEDEEDDDRCVNVACVVSVVRWGGLKSARARSVDTTAAAAAAAAAPEKKNTAPEQQRDRGGV